jgi:putative protein-disulfide isomerase
MNEQYCDPQTGLCAASSLKELADLGSNKGSNRTELIYVGDPMCSWCWGISPDLIKLRDRFKKDDIAFRIVVGGLRPGGGDQWDTQLKETLKHHWDQVKQRSGQSFGYRLFELESFDYNTEPSCRAVVAVRTLLTNTEMEFFSEIQRKFYVDSEDPGTLDFYRSICDIFNVDYAKFTERFESESVKGETVEEFNLSRRWGVQGYPTVLLSHNNRLHHIANGYSSYEKMRDSVQELIHVA